MNLLYRWHYHFHINNKYYQQHTIHLIICILIHTVNKYHLNWFLNNRDFNNISKNQHQIKIHLYIIYIYFHNDEKSNNFAYCQMNVEYMFTNLMINNIRPHIVRIKYLKNIGNEDMDFILENIPWFHLYKGLNNNPIDTQYILYHCIYDNF